MKNFIVKSVVRAINFGHRVEFAKPSNGTVRFNVYKGNKAAPVGAGFYRIRTTKSRRLELVEGETFKTLHFGKVSIGIETRRQRETWNFSGK